MYICMYIYIIYIRHTKKCVGVVSKRNHPQTTSHVVVRSHSWSQPAFFVPPRQIQTPASLYSHSLSAHQSSCKSYTPLSATGDLLQRACILAFGNVYDTSLSSWNSSNKCFAIFTATAAPSWLDLAPTCYMWLKWICTCIFPDIRCMRHTLHMCVLSIMVRHTSTVHFCVCKAFGSYSSFEELGKTSSCTTRGHI